MVSRYAVYSVYFVHCLQATGSRSANEICKSLMQAKSYLFYSTRPGYEANAVLSGKYCSMLFKAKDLVL